MTIVKHPGGISTSKIRIAPPRSQLSCVKVTIRKRCTLKIRFSFLSTVSHKPKDTWNGTLYTYYIRRGSVRSREDEERGTSKRAGRGERMESSWGGDGRPADLKKTEGQGHEHLYELCHTGMPVRNGNLGTDWTATTKAASVRKQLGPKNSKSNEDRQAKNGGVKGRDGSAEELDGETGEEQITVGWTCRKDGGWQTVMTDYRRERQSYVSRAGGDEGGQCWDGRTVLREMWRRQDRRETGRRRQETEEGGEE